jgi:hypothetical protein
MEYGVLNIYIVMRRDRREFDINSKMQAGNAVGKAGILLHGDVEWVGDKHVIHKPYPEINDSYISKSIRTSRNLLHGI